jgi:hypothetical protein
MTARLMPQAPHQQRDTLSPQASCQPNQSPLTPAFARISGLAGSVPLPRNCSRPCRLPSCDGLLFCATRYHVQRMNFLRRGSCQRAGVAHFI